MNIPFLDLPAQHRPLKEEILALWSEILDGAAFIGGKHVAGFEEEFAAACGTTHAVAVNSGTDALRFTFIALGLQAGGEVITTANTFIATTEAIHQAGGQAVFIDVHPKTWNIDPEKIEAAITPKTKGIVPVHLYGQPADMDPILEIADHHGLWVVEDAAQAHLAEYKGRKAGSMGIAAGFSFYPGKNLGACGEAGAVTTGNSEIAQKVRMLRDHGQARKYYHDMEGYNGRCDALQAAALRVKLKHLPEWNEARRMIAQLYLEKLNGAPGIVLPSVCEGVLPVWHLFVIQTENRDEVAEKLRSEGIATGLHYPVPLHLQKAYSHLGLAEGSLPVTEAHCRNLLSLPMYPELSEVQAVHVCDTLRHVSA
jgi:dTDP-4-amino-4,6-dideoxygalactose transaminase